MTALGYVNMSVMPEARRALELLAIELSQKWGRRVTLSEALVHVCHEYAKFAGGAK